MKKGNKTSFKKWKKKWKRRFRIMKLFKSHIGKSMVIAILHLLLFSNSYLSILV